MYKSISGHLNWVHILTIMSSGTINMGVQYVFDTLISFSLAKYPVVK
jgi:hypothetical protein